MKRVFTLLYLLIIAFLGYKFKIVILLVAALMGIIISLLIKDIREFAETKPKLYRIINILFGTVLIVLGIVLKSWWGLLSIFSFLSALSNYIVSKTFGSQEES